MDAPPRSHTNPQANSLPARKSGYRHTVALSTYRESALMQLSDQSPEPPGKILDHAAGIGEADKEMVEQRAGELAEIDGLTKADVNDGHRQQARQELRGAADPLMANDDEGAIGDLIASDDVPGESGVATVPASNAAAYGNEKSVGEALVEEGLDEATHDRMTESRRQEREEDAL